MLGPPHRLGMGSIDLIRADAGFADFLKTLKRSIVANPGGFGEEPMLVLKDPKAEPTAGMLEPVDDVDRGPFPEGAREPPERAELASPRSPACASPSRPKAFR